jgi:acetolactate decarboxylase
VVVPFEPSIEGDTGGPFDHEQLLAQIDELMPARAASCAVRIDGRFDSVRARSVPRQEPPYRPLTEVVAEQHVFELGGHVLGSRSTGLRVRLDPSSELHVELPPGVDLADPDLAGSTHAAVDEVERSY